MNQKLMFGEPPKPSDKHDYAPRGQKGFVLQQLRKYGEFTRNQALQHRITRLAAIVNSLRQDGLRIDAKWDGPDYVYRLVVR